MTEAAVHIVVSGMVQGVGFRYFVFKLAVKLTLKGYVSNLPNGSVEIKAEGDRSLLEELIALVRVGPRLAHVSDLKIAWSQPGNQFHEFDIR